MDIVCYQGNVERVSALCDLEISSALIVVRCFISRLIRSKALKSRKNSIMMPFEKMINPRASHMISLQSIHIYRCSKSQEYGVLHFC